MPRPTVLKASTYRRMPWKNGGGETVEIAVSPEGAGLSEFDWRISMATVATDGPFSIFPGIDRTLSILDGNGMSLEIDGSAPVLLTVTSEPLAFAADVVVSASLAEGTITDLNVMTRRGRMKHQVDRVEVDGSAGVRVDAHTWLALCHRGSVVLEWERGKVELGQGDSVLLEGALSTAVALSGQALVYLISIGNA
jgi:environmental stress-induced protein Ves